MLVILFVIAASLGATMAWFTAESDPLENVFTAGTVEIEAGEVWEYGEEGHPNWNPGDCTDKQFTVTNTGTKGIMIRGMISSQWYLADGETLWNEADPEAVQIVIDIDDPENTGWSVEYDDTEEVFYLYYENRIPGTHDVDEEDATEDELTVTVDIKVCLDGEIANNDYQGKVFKLHTNFQAIQASHGPDSDSEVQWNWDDFEDYN